MTGKTPRPCCAMRTWLCMRPSARVGAPRSTTMAASPAALRLEVAEPAAGEQLDRASHTLGRLRTLGIGIGVDDYGTGGASLANFERLAFDELKVDRSLVADMLANEQNDDQVRAAI